MLHMCPWENVNLCILLVKPWSRCLWCQSMTIPRNKDYLHPDSFSSDSGNMQCIYKLPSLVFLDVSFEVSLAELNFLCICLNHLASVCNGLHCNRLHKIHKHVQRDSFLHIQSNCTYCWTIFTLFMFSTTTISTGFKLGLSSSVRMLCFNVSNFAFVSGCVSFRLLIAIYIF